MSTSQRAVMLCGCGVKAGIVQFARKTVSSVSERIKVLTTVRYTNRRILYFTILIHKINKVNITGQGTETEIN